MSDLGPLASTPVVTTSTSSTAPANSAPAAPSPAPSSGQGAPAQAQPSAPTVILKDDATAIADSARELARGGQISAQVVARDNATLLVRTAANNTLALTNLAQAFEQANLATLNAAIRLQLNPANPQQATVVSVNGATLPVPLAALVQPPTAAQLAIAVSPPQPGTAAAPVLPQAGQTLNAVVVSPPVAGSPAANTAAALPAGSQVQVVVQAVTLPAGTPAATAAPPPAAAAQATPAAVPNVPLPSAQAGTQVTAAPVVPPQQTAPALSQVVATVQTPPAAVQTGQPPATTVQQPVLPSVLQAAAIAQPAAQPTGTVPIPLAASPAAAAQLATAAASAPLTAQVTGVVTGQGQPGQVLVSTPQGVLSLALPNPLPPGTQLALELAAITRPPATTPTQLTPAPLAGVLTRLQDGWPTLQLTLDAIRAADPALAQRLQHDLMPQPNARLATTALQFMAAAAAGSAQAWLGSEAVRKLEQNGRADLLRKLDDDFRELGRLNQRQGDNDWQALVMPMMIGGKVEPIQIFMRRRKDPKKQQKQTRFIIDFNLESTGPIQFDGFVSTKQLDLILRTETEFGPAFRIDVMAIFEEAMAVTGMTGSLRFHEREKPLPWPSPELDSRGPSTEIKA
ncbi:MAG: hypothetical protein VW600_07780 [Ferrovibrio sp.]